MGRCAVRGLVLCAVLAVYSPAWGGLLITDDAGTQGKGNVLVEIDGQYDSEKESLDGVSLKETGGLVTTTFSYGVIDTVDLVLSLPHQWGKIEADGVAVSDEKGIADTTFEVKWRFFEKDSLTLALKPGVILPTGNEEKGLGAGKTGHQLFFIGSIEVTPWAFHANIGYIGNENKLDERKEIWHASLAAACEVVKDLSLVGNIGIERNRNEAADKDPVFLLAGIIYSVSERFDIDFGVKYGLTAAETDWSLMAGVAFRF